MKKIYLDMNIYSRPFDDQSQVRIRAAQPILLGAMTELSRSDEALIYKLTL